MMDRLTVTIKQQFSMKKIFSAALIGCVLLGTVSCDNFLTETPTTSVPDTEAFLSARDYEVALRGVYSRLGESEFMGRDALALGDVASDQSDHSVATSHFYDIFSYQILETNSYLKDIWAFGYKVIDHSTRLITASETVADFSDEDLATVNRCVAQAYGLRALSAFILVNYYGLPYTEANKSTVGIVNVEKPIEPFQPVSRASVEENYRLILSDLANAKRYYAMEGVEDVKKFFMNRAAVAALESRVRLFMQDYPGAIRAAREAIDLRQGSIVSDVASYQDLFYRLDISSEDIFVISKTETDYLTANSLNTLYKDYGVSLNASTLAEFAPGDIRLSVLEGKWEGGKMAGLLQDDGSHLDIQNVPVLRLPEVYLNLAEAYARTGQYAEAKESLLAVAAKRNPALDAEAIRADVSILPVILKERRLELVQEGLRFFDARRLGEKISVSGGSVQHFDVARFVFPVPSKEINAGAGVEQTPGWDANLPR